VTLTVYPQINASRSGERFVRELEKRADPSRELGLIAYKEQFLLYLDRPSVNFGHSRWREGELESYDAALWLNAAANRELLVPERYLEPCFTATAGRIEVGSTARERWFLVSAPAAPECAARGTNASVRHYRRPETRPHS
jgi:hypothetical protein